MSTAEQGTPPLDFEVDVDAFAEIVAAASDADLAAAMGGEYRERILDEIFRQMPERIRPERVRGVAGVLRWRITGRADGGEDVYEVVLRDGSCHVNKGETADPRTTVRLDGVSFVKLIGRKTGPAKLVLTRKLRVQGDVAFAMRSESFFRKPLED